MDAHVHARLEVVRSPLHAEVVGELHHRQPALRQLTGRAAERLHLTAHVGADIEAWIQRVRHARRQPELPRRVDVVAGRLAEQILARHAEPELVDDAAAERVRVAEGRALVVAGLQRVAGIADVLDAEDRRVAGVRVVDVRIAEEETVARADLVIEPGVVLVAVADRSGAADEVVAAGRIVGRAVRQRIVLDGAQRHRIEPPAGQRGRRKGGAHESRAARIGARRKGIVELHRHEGSGRRPHECLREIPLPLQLRRHARQRRHRAVVADALVVEEEERLVAPDRAADRSPELMVAERRLVEIVAVVRPPGGVHLVVAHELGERAAKAVGPRLGDEIDHAPAGHAELRGQRIGLHAEFLHRVDARRHRVLVPLRQCRRAAVEEHRVGAALPAVDAHAGEVEVTGVEERRGQERHSRCEPRQLERIASVQWKLAHARVVDDVAERRRLRVDERRPHVDRFRQVPEVEREIEARGLLDVERHAALGLRAKSRQLDGDRVLAGREQRQAVVALAIGRHGRADAGLEVGDDDGRPGQGRLRRVDHAARDGCLLRRGSPGSNDRRGRCRDQRDQQKHAMHRAILMRHR
jgi:hypothetical protein